MNNDADSQHQLDSHQQLPQMEIQGDSSWKAFFILLVAVNLIFFYYVGMALGQTAGGVSGIGIIPISLILVLIDFFAVFFYIRKRRPDGVAGIISYAALILITLFLLRIVVAALYLVFFIVF